jgi:hypothetical protein
MAAWDSVHRSVVVEFITGRFRGWVVRLRRALRRDVRALDGGQASDPLDEALNVTAAFTWRYFSSVDIDASSSTATFSAVRPDRLATRVAKLRTDLRRRTSTRTPLRGGVVTSSTRSALRRQDRGPPYGNGNTYPGYDTMGRNFFRTSASSDRAVYARRRASARRFLGRRRGAAQAGIVKTSAVTTTNAELGAMLRNAVSLERAGLAEAERLQQLRAGRSCPAGSTWRFCSARRGVSGSATVSAGARPRGEPAREAHLNRRHLLDCLRRDDAAEAGSGPRSRSIALRPGAHEPREPQPTRPGDAAVALRRITIDLDARGLARYASSSRCRDRMIR